MKNSNIRISILTIFLLNIRIVSFSQGITQDATGKSSIVFPGTNIGLNVQETSFDFNYARFSKKTIPNPYEGGHFVSGIRLQGKNTEGLANLFSEGTSSPSTSGKLVFGYTFNLIPEGFTEFKEFVEKSVGLDAKIQDFEDMYMERIEKLYTDKIELLWKENTINIDEAEKLKKGIKACLKLHTNEKLRDDIVNQNFGAILQPLMLSFFDNVIKTKIDEHIKNLKLISRKSESMEETISIFRQNHPIRRITVYGSLGVNTVGFKYFTKLDTNSLRKSFPDTTYIGFEGHVGINYQYGGNWLFGLALGASKISNFDSFNKIEYTSRNTQTYGGQQLVSEKKITAYAPDKNPFQYLWQTTLEIDIVNYSKIGKDGILALNPYFRANWSENIKVVPNVSKVGIGGYFYKSNGSFLGGLYLEFNDLANNLSNFNDKPAAKTINRINFGLVAKVAIASIFGDPSKF